MLLPWIPSLRTPAAACQLLCASHRIAAAGGQNTVEREGISIVHPAKFIMIGSGNPAEGELRPQLLDRFGLSGACLVWFGRVGGGAAWTGDR